MPTELWYSKPQNQLMESAVGIVLKPVGVALELGHWGDMVTQGRVTSGKLPAWTVQMWHWKALNTFSPGGI
jgi:hypothetical protein